MSLRILQLVNRVPWPLTDGGAIGVHYYVAGYTEAGAELSLLCMNTARHPADLTALPPVYAPLKHFEAVPVNNRIRPLHALRSLLDGSSYNIVRFISPAYEAALIRLLKSNEYDVVHFDGLYVAPYLKTVAGHSNALRVMRHHNVEYRIWERLAAKSGNPLKRAYLGLLARRLKAYEIQSYALQDAALPISEEDAALIRAHVAGAKPTVHVHPFGIPVSKEGAIPDVGASDAIYHIGAMDWLPNQQSVDWLLAQVWPLVVRALPGARLHLAGRNMPERYHDMTIPGVTVHGEVPDAAAFEADKGILAVPLQSGGGVRIKIFQAMAAGKCIVTTSVGVEGIEARDGAHTLIANTPEDFAAKLVFAAQHPGERTRLGKAAQALIRGRYNREALMRDLLAFYVDAR